MIRQTIVLQGVLQSLGFLLVFPLVAYKSVVFFGLFHIFFFSEITDLEEWDGDLLIKLPVYDLGVKVYELDLATPELRYYSYDDEFLLLDTAGRVVTDMEEFYAESMEEDLYNILKGTTACLYMGYNPQAMIDEYGGEDAFVEEFADVYGV